MRRRSLVVSGAVLAVSVALAGCAYGVNATAGGSDEVLSAPVESSAPTTPDTADAAALSQAQEWLDAANLPAGAVRTDTPSAGFNSYTGWPCGPYEELEGYWVVPGTTVVEAANWLIQNPTADLVTTSFGPVTEEWGRSIQQSSATFPPPAHKRESFTHSRKKMMASRSGPRSQLRPRPPPAHPPRRCNVRSARAGLALQASGGGVTLCKPPKR